MTRRGFLKLLSAGIASLALSDESLASATKNRRALPMAQFRLLTLHRDKHTYALDIGSSRGYLVACYLLRDARENKAARVHPWLLHTASLIQALAARSHAHEPLIITSGYRTARTNEIVGGAKHSYHMTNERGIFHAMDFHMKSVSVDTLSRYALDVQQGGVGVYNNKGFVHIDVGLPRAWSDV